MIRVKLVRNSIFLFLLVIFISCYRNEVYFEYQPVNIHGWSKDSTLLFPVTITEPNKTYNIVVNTRNNNTYPYQNMWLFVKEISPDSIIRKDTIDFYLADDFGKWLGSGIGAYFNMPVLYRANFKFPKKGVYKFEIQHGMRDSMLIGIQDIGLKVEIAE